MKASVCSDTGWLKNRSHWIFGSNKLDTVYRSYPIYHEYMNEELCFMKINSIKQKFSVKQKFYFYGNKIHNQLIFIYNPIRPPNSQKLLCFIIKNHKS